MRIRFSTASAKAVLDVAVTAAIGLAAVLMIWRSWSGPEATAPAPRRPLAAVEDLAAGDLQTSISGAAYVGEQTSPAVLIEYSDFECPFCARHASGTFKLISDEFVSKGRLQYVFRNFPIEEIHSSAVKAAHAAQCAHRQGKFMDMRAQLFAAQKTLAQMDWRLTASQLHMDGDEFDECLAMAKGNFAEEKQEAVRLGVNSTPVFLLGTRASNGQIKLLTKLTGAQPYSLFKEQIERTLESHNSKRSS